MKKLSAREEEIINLMRKGLSNKEISIVSKLDQKTVSTYVQRIRLKLELEKNCNSYLIVSTYQRINFPTTKEFGVCPVCQEIDCECK